MPIIKEIKRSAFILENQEGRYLLYTRTTTHTGEHIQAGWVYLLENATIFYSELEMDRNTRRLPEVQESKRILVELFTTVVIHT